MGQQELSSLKTQTPSTPGIDCAFPSSSFLDFRYETHLRRLRERQRHKAAAWGLRAGKGPVGYFLHHRALLSGTEETTIGNASAYRQDCQHKAAPCSLRPGQEWTESLAQELPRPTEKASPPVVRNSLQTSRCNYFRTDARSSGIITTHGKKAGVAVLISKPKEASRDGGPDV